VNVLLSRASRLNRTFHASEYTLVGGEALAFFTLDFRAFPRVPGSPVSFDFYFGSRWRLTGLGNGLAILCFFDRS